jgi:hypothetical protein
VVRGTLTVDDHWLLGGGFVDTTFQQIAPDNNFTTRDRHRIPLRYIKLCLLVRAPESGRALGAQLSRNMRAKVEFRERHKNTICRIAPVDGLTLFGLFGVSAMLVFYALEDRSHWFVLAFAGACALGSMYGFLQGAWPFGIVEAIWCVVAGRRWLLKGDRR